MPRYGTPRVPQSGTVVTAVTSPVDVSYSWWKQHEREGGAGRAGRGARRGTDVHVSQSGSVDPIALADQCGTEADPPTALAHVLDAE